MKTLSILASVMVVVFLGTPNKVEAQRKVAERSPSLDSITVPISLVELTKKLGKSYKTVIDAPSGNYYVWRLGSGLEISAYSGTENNEPFQWISFSSRSQKSIPDCPFGFVLNQTTFNEVNSRFNKKLRKLEYQDGFKVYARRIWNHFYFKNNKLIKITIALWEEDKVS